MKEVAEAEGAIEIFAGKILSWLTKLNVDKVFRPPVLFGYFLPLQDYQNSLRSPYPYVHHKDMLFALADYLR